MSTRKKPVWLSGRPFDDVYDNSIELEVESVDHPSFSIRIPRALLRQSSRPPQPGLVSTGVRRLTSMVKKLFGGLW